MKWLSKKPNSNTIYKVTLGFLVFLLLFSAESTQFISVSASYSDESFFDKINLDCPGLEEVKRAVNNQDYETAKQKFVEYMRNRTSPKYFFDWHKKDQLVQLYRENYGNIEYKYITLADSTFDHIFTFGEETRDLGEDINWRQGVNEWTALLNRMQWLIWLGRAYLFTNDEKYSNEFISLIEDWIKDNPVPSSPTRSLGEPWRTLEAGIRADVWVEAYQYFINSPSWNIDSQIRFLNSLSEHADYLYKAAENYGYVNHQIIECTGLAIIGIMFPEFKNAEQWRERAYHRLNQHLQQGTYDDGAHEELTPGYHTVVIIDYLKSARLAQLNNYNSGFDMNRYKKMYEWLMKILMPDKYYPAIGDAGRGNVESYFMSFGTLMFNEPQFKYFSSDFLPEMAFWLFFNENIFEQYNSIPKTKPSFNSLKLPDSQYILMRTGWEVNDKYLLFDCASYGGGHSHSDALNIIVYSSGEQIIDSGTCWYSDPLYISYYKFGRAHNVIIIDGNDAYHAHETPKINNWLTSSNFDFASCSYNTRSNNLHTRKIFFNKPDYWIVSDIIDGSGTHQLDMLYHPKNQDRYSTIISLNGLSPEEKTEPIPSGSRYEKVRGSPYLSYSTTKTLPTTLHTLIYPHSQNFDISANSLIVKANSNALVSPNAAEGFRIDIKKEVATGSIEIKAKGDYCNGWPKMRLRIDGEIIKEWEVNSRNYNLYKTSVEFHSRKPQIDIIFPNDYSLHGKCDRNLYVDYIKINGYKIEAESSAVVYDRGKDEAAFDGKDVIPGQEVMAWNGALRMQTEISQDQFTEIKYSDYFLISHTAPSKKEFGKIKFNGKVAFLREENQIVNKLNMFGGTFLQYGSLQIKIINRKLYITTPSELKASICYPGIEKVFVNNELYGFKRENDCISILAEPKSKFSSIEFFGDTNNYQPKIPNKWFVQKDEGDLRYYTSHSETYSDMMLEYSLIKDRTYKDFDLKMKVKSAPPIGSTIADYDIIFGYQDSLNYYFMMFNTKADYTRLVKVIDGVYHDVAKVGKSLIKDNNYHNVELERINNHITVYFDGEKVLETDDSTFPEGKIGVATFNDPAYFDDINISIPVFEGDLNNDAKVNIQDFQLCVNIILGIETNSDIVGRADINEDGSVSILDVQEIVNIILGE